MTFTLDDIYVYIFSWKHVTANALTLYSSVSSSFPNTFFINCDENTTILDISADRVIQRDDSYYYGSQFETAIQHIPPGKILACSVGDVDPSADWAQIATNAIDAFNTEKAGVYAPNVDFTCWTSRGPLINESKQLYSVVNTDCTCWFLHPTLISGLKDLHYRRLCNLGWGIDHIFCEEAIRKDLLVIRDYRLLVRQPKGTGYNETCAEIEMNLIRREYYTLIGKPIQQAIKPTRSKRILTRLRK
jgi:hypothetical protein